MIHAKNVSHYNLCDLIVANSLDVFCNSHNRVVRGGRMKSNSRKPAKGSVHRSSLRTQVVHRLRVKIQDMDFHKGVLPGLFPLMWPA